MVNSKWNKAGIFTLFAMVTAALGGVIWQYGGQLGLDNGGTKIIVWLLSAIVVLCLLMIPAATSVFHLARAKGKARREELYPAVEPRTSSHPAIPLHELQQHLRYRYGRNWGRRVQLLMVLGESQHVEQLLPGLIQQQWLEGEGNVLIWGGSATAAPDSDKIAALRKLRRQPLDAVIWVSDDQLARQSAQVDAVCRQLHQHYRALGWQLPFYLWEVQQSHWQQDARITQPVGCLLAHNASPESLGEGLQALTPQLSRQGMQQIMQNNSHDFLLRLAQQLASSGAQRLKQSLQPLLAGPHSLPLAGVMFSLPQTTPHTLAAHSWLADGSWQSLLADVPHRSARRLGVAWEKAAQWGMISLAALWGAGTLGAYLTNRHQINSSQSLAQVAVKPHSSLDQHILHQLALQQHIARLQYQAAQGAPWYQRFGLDSSRQQLAALWPWYARSNNELMRNATASHLEQQLAAMPKVASRSDYNHLKALLMMAHPEKSDAAFLSKTLLSSWPERADVDAGLWRTSAPALYGFYAQNLPQHPAWRITPDASQISAARRTLLRTTAARSLEDKLYQQMMHQLVPAFSDMTLNQMVGDTDAAALFTTDDVVPGVFTRQAWDQQVKAAIAKLVDQRREAFDWVLSDNSATAADDLSPQALQARLTQRYFIDYADAWQHFLNSLRWNSAENLADAIDQMTLMTDARQSPLVALMNTVQYQARAGESLAPDAKTLFSADAVAGKAPTTLPEPLAASFGPLLALSKGDAGGQGNNNLSLQTFMTRVNRVRLKLQQITNAADPQAMAQSLAQSVFQGKSGDLADTRDYGSLMSASLGQEWNGFGDNVFVRPLEQAWQQVLSPTSESLNSQWQQSIVSEWEKSFAGRYPFNATQSDASLPLLAKYLRSDTGRIDAFIKSRLSGVLHKEGNQWVPDAINSQGMQINPNFLKAVNQLSALSDILFASGDAGMRFELMARPSRNVVQTDITIDGQDIKYFNQMESWSAVSWPGNVFKPGVLLNWSSVSAGSRQYADYQGSWGLIRLLDRATVKQLDSSRYQLTFAAQDGLPLNYILRTEAGSGPLALLALKGFRLPQQIFL
ncbi:ImcF-related family protein [Candidatus Pantoea communis]|nr:ImcF-related family protein [Pantoea communis]